MWELPIITESKSKFLIYPAFCNLESKENVSVFRSPTGLYKCRGSNLNAIIYTATAHKSKNNICKDKKVKTDFLNLGVHYFLNKKGHVLNTYGDVNYRNVSEYKDTCIKGMETGLFNTLVHPDLFFYGYKDKNGNRVFDDECIKVSKEIIEAAIKYNIYLEVNCNALKKEEEALDVSNWKYPIKEFWLIAKEYKDLKIIVGCDSHAPERLSGFHVDAIYNFIDQIGLNILEKMV